jgi:hypothetical protein
MIRRSSVANVRSRAARTPALLLANHFVLAVGVILLHLTSAADQDYLSLVVAMANMPASP